MAAGSFSERNAQIVERYRDGETLESIGSSLGISRERVRQIVVREGGPQAEDVRKLRRSRKQEATAMASRALAELLDEPVRERLKSAWAEPMSKR